MEKFYIDRQFGQAIWIDVEKGIVKKCYGETEKYNSVMNEKYKGKSITFLKEDFIDRAMAGTYHHLRSYNVVSERQKVAAAESRIRSVNAKIRELQRYTPIKEENKKDKEESIINFKKQVEVYQKVLHQAETALKTEIQRILTEHNFQS